MSRLAFGFAFFACLAPLAACGADPSAADSPSTPTGDSATADDAGDGSISPGLDGSSPHASDASVDAAREPPLPPPPSGTAMGANALDDGGVEFRVWAPHASGVDVTGDFSAQPVALSPEDGGTFAAAVPQAHAGQSYAFHLHSSGQALDRLDPYARAESGGASATIVDPRAFHWSSPAFELPAKSANVLYELHVGSFGDAAAAGHGTFASVIPHLDALRDLGITAIELMPANEVGSEDGWGYNPQAYFAPHRSLGTPDDLRRLVDAAHARGIGVIVDVVYNHYDSGSGAPLRCFDAPCSGNAGVYFFSDPTYATTPWGPRLDFSNAHVADFIVDGAFAWVSEYRMDGLRWDSTNNIRAIDGQGTTPGGAALLRRANDAIHALRPDALLIAEDLKGNASVTATSGAGALAFDTQWDGAGPVVDAVVASSDAARNIDAIRDALNWGYNGDPFARVLYTETHDSVGNGGARLPDKIDPANPSSAIARKRSLLATAALLTAPAVPMLFMGEEMLAHGGFAIPPAQLDWSLSTTNAPIFAFYRDAIRLRRNLDGVSAALVGAHVNVFHVNDNAKVLAYRRWDDAGHDAVVLLNFGSTPYASYEIGFAETGPWHVRLNSDDKKYGADFGGASSADVSTAAIARDGFPFTGSVALGSYSAVVLTR